MMAVTIAFIWWKEMKTQGQHHNDIGNWGEGSPQSGQDTSNVLLLLLLLLLGLTYTAVKRKMKFSFKII